MSDQHQNVPDGWEVVSGAAPPVAPVQQAAGTGSERTRQDTSVVGFDHEKAQQAISNWASTLPRHLQGPAAAIATFPVDVLGSLAEMLSSPEAIATGASTQKGMAALDAVQTGAGRALDASGRLVEKVGKFIEKPAQYYGAWELMHNPAKGTVTIVAPKAVQMTGRGMQSAGQALAGDAGPGLKTADVLELQKKGYSSDVIDRINESLRRPAAEPGTASAGERPTAAGAAPVTREPARAGLEQPTKVKLSPEEFSAAQQLVKQGYDPQDVLHEIVKARAESLSPAETAELDRLVKAGKSKQAATEAIQAMKKLSAKLPTSEEVAASVGDRNANGRWSDEP